MKEFEIIKRYLLVVVFGGTIVYAINACAYDYIVDINPLQRTVHEMRTQVLIERILLLSKVAYAVVVGSIIYKTIKLIKGDSKDEN